MLENTESQEMYLTTIYALQKKNGMVRSVDVADERGYSKVSVHNAMKRLEEFGYVTFHQGKITLTKCGIEKVKNIKQKHQTIASALKLIGASNDIAEENACRSPLLYQVIRHGNHRLFRQTVLTKFHRRRAYRKRFAATNDMMK